MPDPIVLYGTRADGSQAPVQIDSSGRVRINGLGEKGDKGDTGEPGPPGEGGEAGGTGAAATVEVGSVTTGAAGSSASVTNTGTAGAAVFDFSIPRGDPGGQGNPGQKGDKGDPGEPGPKGDTGNTGPARDNSGQQVFPTNGAASTPPIASTGTWFAGGTTTTTKPQVLIEPNGTSSTAWSTAGTGLGVNAPATFAGNILDLQKGGAPRLVVTEAGSVRALDYKGFGTSQYMDMNLGGWIRFFRGTSSPEPGFAINLNFPAQGLFGTQYSRIGWGSDKATDTPDLYLSRDAANILAQYNGANPQASRIYNTYSSATNFERLNIRWASNELIIDAEAGSGGGTLRGIKLGSAGTSLLGFYGATPVVRPAAVADATDAVTAISQLNAVLARLRTLGLIAT